MPTFRRLPRLLLATVAFALPGHAAVVIHEYALQGTLADNLGGSPLTGMGGQITALGYVFAANQGLTLTSPLLNPAHYSLEFSFRFDDVNGYRKLVDFHDRVDDGGFYILNGALNFYPVITANTADFTPNTTFHVVLTRDGASGIVNGYVNGQLRFTFNDTGPGATFTSTGNKVTFFADDFATSQGEASGGSVNYIRVYNGALTATEVGTLFATGAPSVVPEPRVVLLLAGGSLALLARRAGTEGRPGRPGRRPRDR
ncbi:MAG: LamG domain-containing protein [Verrucomicrobia bacterium]|nr:LamG domain-containing protein [Verrucomicrobiota bacterium]